MKNLNNNVTDLLSEKWIPISELWRYNSHRVLWKFGEFGLEGEGNTHVSTGYWMHLGSEKVIDEEHLRQYDPIAFIPMYSKHLVYED